MELGWGVDEGSTWCLDEVGVSLGWRYWRRFFVLMAFLCVCSTDSWFHSSFGSCSVNVGYLVAPWWSILDGYSVDLRIITLVTIVITLESLVKVFTYWSNVQDPMSSPEREVKHNVVNLILIYLFTNNAFYKIDNVTYKYEMIHR